MRTYNKLAPFPEELNRQLTGRIADFHFAPTKKSKDNLLAEKTDENSIVVTGNTVIDALLESVKIVNIIEFFMGQEVRVQLRNGTVIANIIDI